MVWYSVRLMWVVIEETMKRECTKVSSSWYFAFTLCIFYRSQYLLQTGVELPLIGDIPLRKLLVSNQGSLRVRVSPFGQMC